MKLEELRRLAEARTKGNWLFDGEKLHPANLRFVAMSIDHIDALLDVVEWANKISCSLFIDVTVMDEARYQMQEAIKRLESI